MIHILGLSLVHVGWSYEVARRGRDRLQFSTSSIFNSALLCSACMWCSLLVLNAKITMAVAWLSPYWSTTSLWLLWCGCRPLACSSSGSWWSTLLPSQSSTHAICCSSLCFVGVSEWVTCILMHENVLLYTIVRSTSDPSHHSSGRESRLGCYLLEWGSIKASVVSAFIGYLIWDCNCCIDCHVGFF